MDLPLDGTPVPPPVAVFDRHSRVVSIGGMSKAYWGGLRIGWVRASAPLVQRLAAAAGRCGHGQPGPRATGRRASAGRRRTIVAARRSQLEVRRDALIGALHRDAAGVALLRPAWRRDPFGPNWTGPSPARCPGPPRRGVRLAPGPRFGLDGTLERFLRLPFTLRGGRLIDAVRRIASVRHDLERASRPAWRTPSVIA